MKVALVHDWFNDVGGAEKVVREILYCYPDADVFSLIDYFNEERRQKFLLGKKSKTSFIQKIPFSKKYYRFLFPLFPKAIEQLDLSDYDLIISSSSSVAKGVRKSKNQLHICYCHSPARYVWDLREEYLQAVTNKLFRKIFNYYLNKFKIWDLKTNSGVDYFIANSINVQQRIRNNYQRDSVVIYPPVDVHGFKISRDKKPYYIAVSRLVFYKKTSQIIKAFSHYPDLNLLVAGTGPKIKKLKKLATPNVTFLGYIPTSELREKIAEAKAFIANANEDFGITVVEAQASGTPVLVPYLGGYKETVTSNTGVFFKSQHANDIIETISAFEQNLHSFTPEDFANNVERFNKERFRQEFKSFIEKHYVAFYSC